MKSKEELIHKTNKFKVFDTILWLPKGKPLEGWIERLRLVYTQCYTKLISNEDLLYSSGKSIQYCVITYMGKESKKEWICIYMGD